MSDAPVMPGMAPHSPAKAPSPAAQGIGKTIFFILLLAFIGTNFYFAWQEAGQEFGNIEWVRLVYPNYLKDVVNDVSKSFATTGSGSDTTATDDSAATAQQAQPGQKDTAEIATGEKRLKDRLVVHNPTANVGLTDAISIGAGEFLDALLINGEVDYNEVRIEIVPGSVQVHPSVNGLNPTAFYIYQANRKYYLRYRDNGGDMPDTAEPLEAFMTLKIHDSEFSVNTDIKVIVAGSWTSNVPGGGWTIGGASVAIVIVLALMGRNFVRNRKARRAGPSPEPPVGTIPPTSPPSAPLDQSHHLSELVWRKLKLIDMLYKYGAFLEKNKRDLNAYAAAIYSNLIEELEFKIQKRGGGIKARDELRKVIDNVDVLRSNLKYFDLEHHHQDLLSYISVNHGRALKKFDNDNKFDEAFLGYIVQALQKSDSGAQELEQKIEKTEETLIKIAKAILRIEDYLIQNLGRISDERKPIEERLKQILKEEHMQLSNLESLWNKLKEDNRLREPEFYKRAIEELLSEDAKNNKELNETIARAAILTGNLSQWASQLDKFKSVLRTIASKLSLVTGKKEDVDALIIREVLEKISLIHKTYFEDDRVTPKKEIRDMRESISEMDGLKKKYADLTSKMEGLIAAIIQNREQMEKEARERAGSGQTTTERPGQANPPQQGPVMTGTAPPAPPPGTEPPPGGQAHDASYQEVEGGQAKGQASPKQLNAGKPTTPAPDQVLKNFPEKMRKLKSDVVRIRGSLKSMESHDKELNPLMSEDMQIHATKEFLIPTFMGFAQRNVSTTWPGVRELTELAKKVTLGKIPDELRDENKVKKWLAKMLDKQEDNLRSVEKEIAKGQKSFGKIDAVVKMILEAEAGQAEIYTLLYELEQDQVLKTQLQNTTMSLDKKGAEAAGHELAERIKAILRVLEDNTREKKINLQKQRDLLSRPLRINAETYNQMLAEEKQLSSSIAQNIRNLSDRAEILVRKLKSLEQLIGESGNQQGSVRKWLSALSKKMNKYTSTSVRGLVLLALSATISVQALTTTITPGMISAARSQSDKTHVAMMEQQRQRMRAQDWINTINVPGQAQEQAIVAPNVPKIDVVENEAVSQYTVSFYTRAPFWFSGQFDNKEGAKDMQAALAALDSGLNREISHAMARLDRELARDLQARKKTYAEAVKLLKSGSITVSDIEISYEGHACAMGWSARNNTGKEANEELSKLRAEQARDSTVGRIDSILAHRLGYKMTNKDMEQIFVNGEGSITDDISVKNVVQELNSRGFELDWEKVKAADRQELIKFDRIFKMLQAIQLRDMQALKDRFEAFEKDYNVDSAKLARIIQNINLTEKDLFEKLKGMMDGLRRVDITIKVKTKKQVPIPIIPIPFVPPHDAVLNEPWRPYFSKQKILPQNIKPMNDVRFRKPIGIPRGEYGKGSKSGVARARGRVSGKVVRGGRGVGR